MSKTIVITGATSGLGEATAFKLASKGYHLTLVSRSLEKGNKLIQRLRSKFSSQVFNFYQGDFSTIEGSKKVAHNILQDVSQIDVILNNAGAVYSNFKLNEDRVEQTLATNHIGYFVFTLTLLPIMNRESGRIVNVASNSHQKNTLDFDSFTQDRGYFIMKAYGQSKLANIMFTYLLADKLKHTGVTVNALNPGRVKTNIGIKAKHWFHKLAWWIGSRITGGISIDEGIKTHVYLTTSDEVKDISGKYYNQMKEAKSNATSYDKALQEKLWKWSEDVTGLKWSDVYI